MLRSPFGYLVALLVVLVGWMAATVIAAGAWDAVRDANLTPSTEKRADAAGQSVAVFTDIPQPNRDITCVAVDEAEESSTVPAAKINLVIEPDGSEWTLIGLLPRGRDGLQITCTPRDRGVDNASYAYAVVEGFAQRGRTGQIVATVGLIAGLGLTVATYLVRRSARKESQP